MFEVVWPRTRSCYVFLLLESRIRMELVPYGGFDELKKTFSWGCMSELSSDRTSWIRHGKSFQARFIVVLRSRTPNQPGHDVCPITSSCSHIIFFLTTMFCSVTHFDIPKSSIELSPFSFISSFKILLLQVSSSDHCITSPRSCVSQNGPDDPVRGALQKDTTEQPSPVSILEPPFEEEFSSSECFEKISAGLDGEFSFSATHTVCETDYYSFLDVRFP